MKTYKLFDCPWHVSHNYSLCNIPNTEWGLLLNNVRTWNVNARPVPKNVKWVSYYEPGKYDIAVLHIDQQCIDPRIGKGILYRNLNSVIKDIPKIIINHGTPYWPERWETSGNAWKYPSSLTKKLKKSAKEASKHIPHQEALRGQKENEKLIDDYQKEFLIKGGKTIERDEEIEIEGMKRLIGDGYMVVNSHEAKKKWGWGHVIIHGLDPEEWWDLPKEPRVITVLSPAGLDAYYNREMLGKIKSQIKERFGLRMIHVGDPRDWVIDRHPLIGEIGGYGAYRDFLGRSLVYVNPTFDSPMPRSRTEAMLSGCCVLTTPYHGAEEFINFDTRRIAENSEGIDDYVGMVDSVIDSNDKINGFIIPDNPSLIAGLCNHLVYSRYKKAVQIGQNGKETARKIFSKKRFDKEWLELIKKALDDKSKPNKKTKKN